MNAFQLTKLFGLIVCNDRIIEQLSQCDNGFSRLDYMIGSRISAAPFSNRSAQKLCRHLVRKSCTSTLYVKEAMRHATFAITYKSNPPEHSGEFHYITGGVADWQVPDSPCLRGLDYTDHSLKKTISALAGRKPSAAMRSSQDTKTVYLPASVPC